MTYNRVFLLGVSRREGRDDGWVGRVARVHSLICTLVLAFLEPDIQGAKVPLFDARAARVNGHELHAILAIQKVKLVREIDDTLEALFVVAEQGCLRIDLQLLFALRVNLLQGEVQLVRRADCFALGVEERRTCSKVQICVVSASRLVECRNSGWVAPDLS